MPRHIYPPFLSKDIDPSGKGARDLRRFRGIILLSAFRSRPESWISQSFARFPGQALSQVEHLRESSGVALEIQDLAQTEFKSDGGEDRGEGPCPRVTVSSLVDVEDRSGDIGPSGQFSLADAGSLTGFLKET